MASDTGGSPWLPKHVGIGVDFGMTYSGAAVAFEMPGGALSIEPVPINNVVGESKFPTAVYVSPDKRTIDVGEDAYTHPDTENIHELFKRHLGSSWSARPNLDAIELTKYVLTAIKRDIDTFLSRKGFDTSRVERKYVFCYPGTWEPERMLALKSAIEQAGFGTEYHMLDEAIATAIGAAQVGGNTRMLGGQETTFVCDFGGGTTDFTLAQATATGLIRVKFAAGGNPLLGMSNLDKVIAMLIANKMRQLQMSGQRALSEYAVAGAALENAWKAYLPDPRWKAKLLRRSEAIKRNAFRDWRRWESDFMQTPDGVLREITKAELEPFVRKMNSTLAENVQSYLTESVALGRLHRDMVRFVVIGGGGSALPGIGATLTGAMTGAPELLQIDPTIATSLVQRGAAFHGLNSTIYDRRSNHHYGVKTYRLDKPSYHVDPKNIQKGDRKGGVEPTYYPWYEVYVHRNDIIAPGTSISRPFNPLRANQSAITFEVLRGENPDPFQNTRIGEVDLPLPPKSSTDYHADCEFTIGKDGLLLVKATGDDKRKVQVTLRWQTEALDE